MKKNIILLFFLLTGTTPVCVLAQDSSTVTKPMSRWYVGGQAGISFGSSTFQSIGADKTRIGWETGIFSGYRINSFLSAEASLDYTRMELESYTCCQSLWFDKNGNRHNTALPGNDSYSYKDIYSGVNLWQVGLHLNVDVLKIFKPQSRWSVMLSPAIYGISSTAKIKAKEAESFVDESSGRYHAGVGGDLGIGYQINQNINIRLFSGVNYLTGRSMDALPRVEHTSNYVWNSGVKVLFSLGNKNKVQKTKTNVAETNRPVEEKNISVDTLIPIVETPAVEKTEVVVTAPVEAVVAKETSTTNEKAIHKVTIYYDTNSANVKKQFYLPIAKFLNDAKKNTNAKVVIQGWANNTGTEKINNRISYLRAKVLQQYFVSQKIDSNRISFQGNGVDTKTSDDGRRVDVSLIVQE